MAFRNKCVLFTSVVLCVLMVNINAQSEIEPECRMRWDKFLDSLGEEREGFLLDYSPIVNRCDHKLKREMRKLLFGANTLDYWLARHLMFTELDNKDGVVCGVYTGKCVHTNKVPNANIMNCEHTWPRSKGARGKAKSDLYHLYPSDSRTNSTRGNYPFCEVVYSDYMDEGSKLGYSQWDTHCFEPWDRHKGNVARSMFYFSVRYSKRIDFEQEYFFRKWMTQDPVDEKERVRAAKIAEYQDVANPFISYPSLIDLIQDF